MSELCSLPSSKQEQGTKKAPLVPSKRTIPQPKNHLIFDPWNSSSTGHQRPQNDSYSSTTSWRETRRRKLAGQFLATNPNQAQKTGTEGAREEWRWMSAQEARRTNLGVGDIRRYMGVVKSMSCRGMMDEKLAQHESESESLYSTTTTKEPVLTVMSAYEPTPPAPILEDIQQHKEDANTNAEEPLPVPERTKRGIFSNLTFYINGSTYPIISEHKLKHLLAAEGGCISLHLARRAVTHVILPTSGAPGGIARAGGLLAAGKLQKEGLKGSSSRGVGAGGGKGIKYVTVEWAIESIKAGKKLPEARFGASTNTTRSTGLVGAPVGQRSVYDMFRKEPLLNR
ncbi:hypothetical protein UA08_04428 [Talaromyces atroroseus]|uniref:BRCT domain-containing protein n=1 Tax=Talaromyces atroroseus TaxID=1441469 RepID=A0A1Q5Q8L2_TALAT|nr:hypothetical protein UA08_04428 [Talaromyces atroroseus]OKL60467.1 hypothetical protein UA08_04428 [Talaromyces atroroseus]